jgi:hypothetical protein
LTQLHNVRYVFTEAKRSDFGGYAHVLNEEIDLVPYEHIFFINASVRGPYDLPHERQTWVEVMLAPFQQLSADGGSVGMVGTSICILDQNFRHSIQYQQRFGGLPPYSHVQTMAYVLPKHVLEKLIADGFYQEDRDSSKTLAIENYEIHLSQLVLQQGRNLRCLLPEFNRIDYRLPHKNPNPTSTVGDPNEVLGYFGRSVHPYEILFVKTNRHLYTEAYLARLTYSMAHAKGGFENLASKNDDALFTESVVDYLTRVKNMALSPQSVSDFSYLPGDLDNREKLKTAQEQAFADRTLLNDMLQSTSWKITRPLRWIKDLLSS